MTPHNLPARGKLTAREEPLLADIRQAVLDPQVPIVTLLGPAGVGKTAFAVEIAHRLLEEGSFPGGIVWLDCSHAPTLEAMAETMRSTFGLPQVRTVQQDVQVYLRSHSCLLIFDAYDVVAQDLGVLAFLNHLPLPSKALVTSRERVGLLAQERLFTIQPVRPGVISLELLIQRATTGHYRVIVDGEHSHTLNIAAIQLMEERHQGEVQHNTRQYGRRLFQALFPERSVSRKALTRLPLASASDDTGMLHIVTEDPEAQMIPWEYLHDGKDFLALKYHVLRGIPAERRQGYGAEMPAAALDLIAVPSDPLLLNDRPVDQLDAVKEIDSLKTALQEAQAPYRALIVTPPTLDALHEALAPRGRQTIVHFIGHGLATEQGAILLFEDEAGIGRAISARDFAYRVRGNAFLVFLNACESATSLGTSVSNLAYSLAIEGLPYALGMQFSVPDVAALKLARFFYRFLAAGHSVEEAVRQARIALAAADDLNGLKDYAIGIPVLYTSLVRGFARFRSEPGTATIQEISVRQEFDTEISETSIFRGRRHELAEIGQRLQKGTKVLTLAGPGGSGKSTLARNAATRFAWRFPDGILGLSLESLPTKEEIISRLAHWLRGSYLETLASDAREREVRAAFKSSQSLLILDNYETLLAGFAVSTPEDNKKARALGQFLRSLAGDKGTILVTSRDRRTGLPREGRPLDVLDLDLVAALQLFRDHAGERWGEAEKNLLASLQHHVELGRSLDDLPAELEGQPLLLLIRNTGPHALAIELLASVYAEGDESIVDFLSDWQEHLRQARDQYRGEDERHVTLTACFDYSYSMLPPTAKELFPKLTIFMAPFLADIVEAVISAPKAGELLNLLFRKSLLQRQDITEDLLFYFFHPMARWYAEEKVRGVDLAPIKKELGLAYLDLVHDTYGKLDKVNSLAARVMLPDLSRAVEFLPDRERTRLAFDLGWLLRIFGEPERAMELYQEALRIDERLGDLRGQGATLYEMANVHQVQGELERAMALYREALGIAEQSGNLQGQGATLRAMANIHQVRGEPDRAMDLYQETLHIEEQLGNLQGTSATLHAMANIHQVRGEPDRAMDLYREALRIDEQLGNLQGEGATLREMANIHQVRGESDRAMDLYREALRIFEQLGDLQGQGATLYAMANIHQVRGESDRAMDLYREALRIFEQLGDLRGKGATLRGMANIHQVQGKWERAMELYQESLRIVEQLGDRRGQGATLYAMAIAHRERGELERAMELYQESLRIVEQLGDLRGKSAVLYEMAIIYQVRGELERAMELYREALGIAEQLGDLRSKGTTLAMRGQLLAAAGEKALALQDFVQALVTLANIGAHDAAQVVEMIRRLRASVGDEEFNSLWRKVTGQEEVPEWFADPQRTNVDRLLTRAATQEERKDWQAASETYNEVLSLLRRRNLSNDEQRQRAKTVLRLGVCLRQDGQWGAAIERLQDAFRLFKGLKDFHGQGLTYLEIARAYQAMNSYDLALLHYKDASRLFKRAGHEAMAAAAYEEAGNLQVYLRVLPGAIADLEEAARLYRAANVPSRAAIVDQNLELARHAQE
jgi:tetratricopeptide (TPR) repeat protein